MGLRPKIKEPHVSKNKNCSPLESAAVADFRRSWLSIERTNETVPEVDFDSLITRALDLLRLREEEINRLRVSVEAKRQLMTFIRKQRV